MKISHLRILANLLVIFMLTSSCKKTEEQTVASKFGSENEFDGSQIGKAIEEEFGSKVVDFANIPNNLFVFYELNNQLQSTSTFLIADYIGRFKSRIETDKEIRYVVEYIQRYYQEGTEQHSKVYDDEFIVPKGNPFGKVNELQVQGMLRPFKISQIESLESNNKKYSFHNWELSRYRREAPERVVARGDCGDCQINVVKMSFDLVSWETQEVEHYDWEISADIPVYIHGDMNLFNGTVSQCIKKFVTVDSGKVLTSQCQVLRDYGVLEEL